MSNKYNEAITIRLTSKVKEEVKALAEQSQTSEGSIIRQAISKFLKEYK